MTDATEAATDAILDAIEVTADVFDVADPAVGAAGVAVGHLPRQVDLLDHPGLAR